MFLHSTHFGKHRKWVAFKRFSLKISIILYLILYHAPTLFSQTDTKFWLAVPYETPSHGGATQAAMKQIVLSTLGSPATVTISIPANPAFTPIVVDMLGNSTNAIDLADYNDLIQNIDYDLPVNKGILIESTDLITAYLELPNPQNTDIFALKGRHALGLEFYTPFQTKLKNQTYTTPNEALSSIDIVATENNTTITITPTVDVGNASGGVHAAGVPYSVVLQKGQAYSVRATGGNGIDHPAGTHIVSDKPIAVTIKDDSVIAGGGWDMIGDQITPVDFLGTQYIVMKGKLDQSGADADAGTTPEYVYVVATEDGTTYTINGVVFAGTYNKGQQVAIPITTADNYVKIESNTKKFYMLHVSGNGAEIAGAVAPPTDQCSGSPQVGFTYRYGASGQGIFVNILARQGAENFFLVDGAAAAWLNPASFTPVPGGIWSTASFGPLVAADLAVGGHVISNTKNLFHMGYLNYTGPGAMYGYFSDFEVLEPKAVAVKSNLDSVIVCRGEDIQLRCEGGFTYTWTGKNDVTNADATSYLSSTTIYNPKVDKLIPAGNYTFTVVVPSVCGSGLSVTKTVKVKVQPTPVAVNPSATFCETVLGSGCVSGIDLTQYESAFTGGIIGTTVTKWEKEVFNDLFTMENYDNERHFINMGSYASSLSTSATNPAADFKNPDPITKVMKLDLANTGAIGGYVKVQPKSGYDFDLNNGAIFKMLVYNHVKNTWAHTSMTSYSKVTMRLISATDSVDVSANMSKFFKWEDLTFDFSAAPKKLYSNLKILFFGTGADYQQDIFYVDSIRKQINYQRVRIADPYNTDVCSPSKIFATIHDVNGCIVSATLSPVISATTYPVNNINQTICQNTFTSGLSTGVDLTTFTNIILGASGITANRSIYNWEKKVYTYDSTYENFDNIKDYLKWNTIVNDAGGTQILSETFANPNKNLTNTSNTVAKITQAGCNTFNASIDLAQPIDLNEGYIFKMLVSYNWAAAWQNAAAKTVTMELIGPSGTVSSAAVSALSATTTPYDWIELTFDFTAVKTQSGFERINFKFNSTPYGGVDWYFDNFRRVMSSFTATTAPAILSVQDSARYWALVTDTLGCKTRANVVLTVNPNAFPINNLTNYKICETGAKAGEATGFDLSTLSDTIIGKAGKAAGRSIYSWDKLTINYDSIIENFNTIKDQLTWSTASTPTALNKSTANPNVNAVNGSTTVGKVPTTGANDFYVNADLPSLLDLSKGYVFKLLACYDWINTWDNNATTTVKMELFNSTGSVSSGAVTIYSGTKFDWKDISFDFSAFKTQKGFNKMKLTFHTGNWGNCNFYFDNLRLTLQPFTSIASQTTNLTIQDTATFYAWVKDAAGCLVKAKANVKVMKCSVTAIDQTATFCESTVGSGIKTGIDLTTYDNAVKNNLSNCAVTWYTDANITSAVATPAIASATNNKIYYAKVKDSSSGDQDTATLTITVNSMPTVNIADVSICKGNSTSLTATSAMTTYNWDNNATTQSITVNPTTTTTYSITITNAKTCTNTDNIIVTVNSLPTVNIADVAICKGNSTTLSATAAMTTYTWSTGASAISITVNPTTTTTYAVTITDANACTDRDSLTVTVNPLPTVNIADVAICKGSSTTITAPASMSLYAWSTGESSQTITVNPTVITTYVITITDVNTCTDRDTLTISINTNPSVDAGPDQTTCKTSPAQINATQNAGWTYVWVSEAGGQLTSSSIYNPKASLINTAISINTSIAYHVTVTDNSTTCIDRDTINVLYEKSCRPSATATASKISICRGESTIIRAVVNSEKGIQTMQWSDGTATYVATTASGATPYTVADVLVTPTATSTTYTLTVSDTQGGTDLDSVVIIINELPTATVTSTAVCPSSAATLTASGGGIGAVYTWQGPLVSTTYTSTPAVAGNYTVTVVDAKGCSDTESGTITINAVPTVNAGVDKVICKDEAQALTANSTTATTFTWSCDANTLLSSTNSAITSGELKVKAINLDESHTYTVSVSDINTCTASDEVVVLYQAQCKPTVLIVADPKTKLCLGESTTLRGTIVSQKILTKAEWIVDGVTTNATFTGTSPNYTVSDYLITPNVTTTYILKATDNTNSEGQTDIIITVNPLPTAVVPAVTVCPTTSATLTATGAGIGGSYAWSSISSVATLSLDTAVASTYTVTVTDINGCTDSEEGYISLYIAPQLTPMADKRTCKSAAITITPTTDPTWKYNWSSTPASSLVSATSDIPTVSYLSPGTPESDVTITYSVTITDANSCTSTDDIIVTYEYNCKPYIYPAATKYNLCSGETTVISATTSSEKPIVGIAWSIPNFNITPPMNPTGPFTITPTRDTTIIAYIYDNQGKGDTASITITVSPLPTADAGFDDTICANDSKTLSVINKGINGIQSVVWLINNSTPISNTKVTPNVTTTYTAFITDTKGCKSFDDVIVNVNQLPLASAGNTATICPSLSTTLTASGGISYKWSTGAITDTIIPSPTISPTTYKVTVTDANFCSATSEVQVKLHAKAVASAGIDTSICIGQTTTELKATGGVKYIWNTTETTDKIIANPTTLGPNKYSVTVTTTDGCIGSAEVNVEGFDSTKANAGNSLTICKGKSATLQEVNAGMKYAWSNAETTQSITVSPVNTATYTVTITNTHTCTASDSLIVTVNQLPAAIFTLPTTAICINENPFSINTATPFITSTYWGKGVSGITFTPSIGGVGVDTIYYSFSDNVGCSNQTFATVNVVPLPIITMADTSICEGQSTKLTAGDASRSYIWNDNKTAAERTETPKNPGINTYTVTVTDVNKCTAKSSVVIFVNPTPIVNFTTDIAVGCEPFNAVFVDSTYPKGKTFEWNFGDSLSPKVVTTKDSSINHVYTKAGTYTIIYKVTSLNGCVAKDTFPERITVMAKPVADFSFNPQHPTNFDSEVTFKDLSQGNIAEWYWDFGDPNSVSNIVNDKQYPIHNFAESRIFNVMLAVATEGNCYDTVYKNIVVKSDFTLFAPNAFTPNGDNVNDSFGPVGVGIDINTWELYVFSRWGEQLFFTTDISEKWDGRKFRKGEILQDDVYTWTCTFKDLSGKEYKYNGAIALIH